MDYFKECTLCPRKCKVNRHKNYGYCGANDKLKIAHYSLHEWEEPLISGINGSGTIFFSNCNLKCIFCQNKKISSNGYGKYITTDRLKEIMLELKNKGAHNINLVTPTMYVPFIIEALDKINLNIPIVYNTSGYENVEVIKLLDDYIDIYLTDFKYFDNTLGEKYSKCSNYFEITSKALDEMVKQKPNIVIENNIMKKGVIVRILILPGHIDDSKKILKYLYEKYKDKIIISIMNQYTPMGNLEYDNLNRKLREDEYNEVINYACDLGITKAFIQEGDTQLKSFIPEFDCSNI